MGSINRVKTLREGLTKHFFFKREENSLSLESLLTIHDCHTYIVILIILTLHCFILKVLKETSCQILLAILLIWKIQQSVHN